MNKCKYCQREFSTPSGRGVHEIQCPSNPDRKSPQKGREAWNKGLTKKTDPRIAAQAEKQKKDLASGKLKHPGKYKRSEDVRKRLSEVAKERGLGGVRPSRWVEYNGVMLGSTYEVEVAKSLDSFGVKWEKPSRFNYIDPNGKARTYTPDFYLSDFDVYLDPKNDFLINNVNPRLGFSDLEKIRLVEQHNNITVIVLDKDNLGWEQIKELL